MPIKTGEEYGLFWNSSNGDRKYNAEHFSELLRKFFVTGVFANELAVRASTGMQVTVDPGWAFIEGKIKRFKEEDDRVLTIADADATYPRIDTIVVECSYSDRDIRLKYVKGSPSASTPSAPAPVRDTTKYEIVLAHIYVSNGATSISQSAITDTRLNSELCGLVRGTVDEIDWDDITAQFSQYIEEYKADKEAGFDTWEADKQAEYNSWINENEADFLAWFDRMKGQLDTDAAAHLQGEIDNVNSRMPKYTFQANREGSRANYSWVNLYQLYRNREVPEGIFTTHNGYWFVSRTPHFVNPQSEPESNRQVSDYWIKIGSAEPTPTTTKTNISTRGQAIDATLLNPKTAGTIYPSKRYMMSSTDLLHIAGVPDIDNYMNQSISGRLVKNWEFMVEGDPEKYALANQFQCGINIYTGYVPSVSNNTAQAACKYILDGQATTYKFNFANGHDTCMSPIMVTSKTRVEGISAQYSNTKILYTNNVYRNYQIYSPVPLSDIYITSLQAGDSTDISRKHDVSYNRIIESCNLNYLYYVNDYTFRMLDDITFGSHIRNLSLCNFTIPNTSVHIDNVYECNMYRAFAYRSNDVPFYVNIGNNVGVSNFVEAFSGCRTAMGNEFVFPPLTAIKMFYNEGYHTPALLNNYNRVSELQALGFHFANNSYYGLQYSNFYPYMFHQYYFAAYQECSNIHGTLHFPNYVDMTEIRPNGNFNLVSPYNIKGWWRAFNTANSQWVNSNSGHITFNKFFYNCVNAKDALLPNHPELPQFMIDCNWYHGNAPTIDEAYFNQYNYLMNICQICYNLQFMTGEPQLIRYAYNASQAFYNCKNLNSELNVVLGGPKLANIYYRPQVITSYSGSPWNFSPIERNTTPYRIFTGTFRGCTNFESINLNFNGFPVYANYMFENCSNLHHVNLSNIYTQSTLCYMFANCGNISSIDIYPEQFSSSSYANFYGMFSSSLTNVTMNLYIKEASAYNNAFNPSNAYVNSIGLGTMTYEMTNRRFYNAARNTAIQIYYI